MSEARVNKDEILREWIESAPYWHEHNRIIRTMFMPVTEALVKDAGIGEGHSVLDVAGGPGEPSLTIAEKVGSTGSVTCTDAVAEMVFAAEDEARKRGLTNVTFRRCVADSLPFSSSSFDVVVCRLGAMFFPDPLKGVREMVRVTKPGGALSFAVWHKSELNPFVHVVTQVASRYFAMPPAEPNEPGAFRFAERGALANLLKEAGAADISERVLRFNIAAPISPGKFWQLRSQTSGTLREKLATLSPDQSARLAREVQDAVREFFPSDGMSFPAQMIIVTGKKSG